MPKAELDAVTGGDEQTLIATVMEPPLEEEQFEHGNGKASHCSQKTLSPESNTSPA